MAEPLEQREKELGIKRQKQIKNKDLVRERRQQIQEAALQLFLEKGYNGTTIKDISDKSGINPASMYDYVLNKADILRMIFEELQGPNPDNPALKIDVRDLDSLREYLRMQPVQIEIADHDMECTHCPERLNVSGELAERLLELMRRLPENQRQVLALVVLEDFSYREVAETLNIPIGTVMSRLSRARRYLAEQLHTASEPVNTPDFHLRRVK